MIVITVARKPLEGTVASNSLKWGTGGINIDASRISHTEDFSGIKSHAVMKLHSLGKAHDPDCASVREAQEKLQTFGRFPANIVLSPETAMALDEQSSTLHARGNVNPTKRPSSGMFWGAGQESLGVIDPGDVGGASRFFKVVAEGKP